MKELSSYLDNHFQTDRALSPFDSIKLYDILKFISNDELLLHALNVNGVRLNKLGLLRMPSQNVSDSTLLLGNYNDSGHLVGVLHISQIYDPCQVARSCNNARMIYDVIPEPFNKHVLCPLYIGEIYGRSFSYTEYVHPLSSNFYWSLQKRLMQRPVLSWLCLLANYSSFHEDFDCVMENLYFFKGKNNFANEFSELVGESKKFLDNGKWKPLCIPDHNDLWRGNILMDKSKYYFNSFKIIDWGAANIQGYGVHDLLTFSLSFGVSDKALAPYLKHYMVSLNLDKKTLLFQYLAGMGYLGRNINNFPYQRYCVKVNNEFEFLVNALKCIKL